MLQAANNFDIVNDCPAYTAMQNSADALNNLYDRGMIKPMAFGIQAVSDVRDMYTTFVKPFQKVSAHHAHQQ